MSHIFHINWNVQRVFGFEGSQSFEAIVSIAKGIQLKDSFEPVSVYHNKGMDFYLSTQHHTFNEVLGREILDGGHHRAIAHYIVQKPLKCVLVEEPNPEDLSTYFNIAEAMLFDDKAQFEARKRVFGKYRTI